MRIQVLYFAVFRERVGSTDEELELPPAATVADAITVLGARHASITQLRGRFRVAVNQDFVDEAHVLAEGDELALIPPVAGGAAERHVLLSGEMISLDRCLAAVMTAEMGGVVTFTGVVRRHSRGMTVEHLEYEAYGAMAVKTMMSLCEEIEAEVPGARIAVEHRVGHLVVGDIAVVIAAAAPHRAEAFTACRAMIDRLKDRVPIWKKEVGDDGEEWIGLGP